MHLCISRFMRYLAKQKYQYLVTGVPHPPVSRKQTWEGERRPHLKGWAAGHKRFEFLWQDNGRGSASHLGMGPVSPCVPDEGHSVPATGALDPQPSPVPPRATRTPERAGRSTPPGGVRHVSRTMGAGASLLLEDSPTYRIKYGWLRRALPLLRAGSFRQNNTVTRLLPR